MTESPNNPYAEREKDADKATKERMAHEESYLRDLMETPAGKWILGDILSGFETELQRRTTGHNSDDSYHRGKQDAAKKYRDLIIKHFGHSGIDRIMKGL